MTALPTTGDPSRDRLPWPADWFDTHDPGEADNCRRLWVAVLMAKLRDSLDALQAGLWPIEGQDMAALWAATMGWTETRDFEATCVLAGFEPDALRAEMRAKCASREGAARLAARVALIARAA